jgi:hypothetical protein
MTTNITDEILGEAVQHMPPTFDSHDVIRDLMRHWPREYASDLCASVGADPILTLHSTIGTRLSSFDTIEKAKKVKSMNVRGEYNENQEWRKK